MDSPSTVNEFSLMYSTASETQRQGNGGVSVTVGD